MSTEPIVYDFQAHGIRDVQQAFVTVEQAMLKAEKAAIESERRQALGRLDAARKGAEQRAKIAQRETEQLTHHEKLALSRHKAHEEARTDLARREGEKRLRWLKDFEEQHTEKVKQEADKRKRAEEEALRSVTERRRQFASTVSGAAMGSVRQMFGTAAHWGGMALTLGGGLSVTQAAHNSMRAETAALALANTMFKPSDAKQQEWLRKNSKDGRFDHQQILSFAAKTAAYSGFSKDEIARGWQDYVAKSDDWETLATPEGKKTLMELAKLAKATDSNFGDVMGAAGSLRMQNEKLTQEAMLDMMRSIVGQGKMGAVEMPDLAKHSSVITAGAGSYAMDQTKAQRALLGLTQVAIQTSGSPAEAATAVKRFADDVQHKSKDMKKHFGIDVTADPKTGALKAPSEILAEIFEKTQGNSSKFGEGKGNVGLGRESVRVAQALMPRYQEAVANAKAQGITDDKKLAHIGAEAVKKYVARFENAGYDQENIDEDFKRVMSTTQERFDKVTRDLMEKLEARVVPFLEKLAVALERGGPELEKFMDAMARVASFIIENPWSSLAMAVSGKLVTDIGNAAIGQKVGDALTAAIKNTLGVGGTGPVGAAGAPGGGVGIGTAALIGAGAYLQVAGLYVTTMEVKEWMDAGKKEGEAVARDMASGDPVRRGHAIEALKKAHATTGDHNINVIGAYLTTALRYAGWYFNPGGQAAKEYVTDEAAKAVGGKTPIAHAREALKAKELIDTYDLQMSLANALREGIRQGTSSDPGAPHRREPISFTRD